MHPPSHTKGLRTVATIEATKGGLVLLAGFGLLAFIGRDAEQLAELLVRRFYLNPAHHYPQIFVRWMANVTDTHLWQLAGLAALYSAVRFVEAYGLWHARRWAEWFAALSGAVYIPVEIYWIMHRASWERVALLVTNVAIVAYMAWLLTESIRLRRLEEKASAGIEQILD